MSRKQKKKRGPRILFLLIGCFLYPKITFSIRSHYIWIKNPHKYQGKCYEADPQMRGERYISKVEAFKRLPKSVEKIWFQSGKEKGRYYLVDSLMRGNDF